MRPLVPDVTLEIDGRRIAAVSGQSVYGVLVAERIWHQAVHPVGGGPQAGSCAMGTCSACTVEVDGRAGVRACSVEVTDGMRVRTAAADPSPSAGTGVTDR